MTTCSPTRRYLFRVVAAVLVVGIVSSTLPLQAWSPLYGVPVVHASPPEAVVRSAPTTTGPLGAPLEQAAALRDMGLLASDGQPNAMLMDVGAQQTPTPAEPDPTGNPLSISRVQSAYRAADAISGTVVITFTVTNNLPPVSAPDISDSATLTDTIAAVSTFDYLKDPNAIRNVMVVDALTTQVSFISSSPVGDRSAAEVAWNLGDIPPLGSVTATLTVQVAGPVSDFADLDTGATAWGTLRGRAVSAQARPASLPPDTIDGEPIGDWLKWTVDADTRDEYMLAKAAELGQDPQRMFEYVRSLGYESYKGSLRGTRGTLWVRRATRWTRPVFSLPCFVRAEFRHVIGMAALAALVRKTSFSRCSRSLLS